MTCAVVAVQACMHRGRSLRYLVSLKVSSQQVEPVYVHTYLRLHSICICMYMFCDIVISHGHIAFMCFHVYRFLSLHIHACSYCVACRSFFLSLSLSLSIYIYTCTGSLVCIYTRGCVLFQICSSCCSPGWLTQQPGGTLSVDTYS